MFLDLNVKSYVKILVTVTCALLSIVIQRITSGSGLEIFVYINHILTKLYRQKLGSRVIMEHRVVVLQFCATPSLNCLVVVDK